MLSQSEIQHHYCFQHYRSHLSFFSAAQSPLLVADILHVLLIILPHVFDYQVIVNIR